jgi:hypothetical protein
MAVDADVTTEEINSQLIKQIKQQVLLGIIDKFDVSRSDGLFRRLLILAGL